MEQSWPPQNWNQVASSAALNQKGYLFFNPRLLLGLETCAQSSFNLSKRNARDAGYGQEEGTVPLSISGVEFRVRV